MTQVPSRLFAKGLLGLMFVFTLGFATIYWHIYGAAKMFGDFDIFYHAAQHAAAGDLQAIYDIAHLRQIYESDNPGSLSFFLNPPTALFIIQPLAHMSSPVALIVWTAAQIALLALALCIYPIRSLFAGSSDRAIPTSLLLPLTFAAFCLQNILFGQVAVFCAALFLLVFGLRKTNPALAGILLGIFSFKPQLGILLPVLLVAEENWAALAAAGATAAMMIVLSVHSFGWALWGQFHETLSILQGFLARPQPTLFALTTSAYAALRNLGVPDTVAALSQLGLSAAVVKSIWGILKTDKESYKLLIVTLGTYLATPYSLIYDIPLLAVPCALMLRRAEADEAAFSELIALLLLIGLPLLAILLQIMHIPYSVIAISVALGVARRRFGQKQPNDG